MAASVLDLVKPTLNSLNKTSEDTNITLIQEAIAQQALQKRQVNDALSEMMGDVEAIDFTTSQLRNYNTGMIDSVFGNITQLTKQKNGYLTPTDMASIQNEFIRLESTQNKLKATEKMFIDANIAMGKDKAGLYDKQFAAAELQRLAQDPMGYNIEDSPNFPETGNPFLSIMPVNPDDYLTEQAASYRKLHPEVSKSSNSYEKDGNMYTKDVTKYGDDIAYDNWFSNEIGRNIQLQKGVHEYAKLNPTEFDEAYINEAERAGVSPSVLKFMDSDQYKSIRQRSVEKQFVDVKPVNKKESKDFTWGDGGIEYDGKNYPLGQKDILGHKYDKAIVLSTVKKSQTQGFAFSPQGVIVELGDKGKRELYNTSDEGRADYKLNLIDEASGVMVLDKRIAPNRYATFEVPINGNEEFLINYGIDPNQIPKPTKDRGYYATSNKPTKQSSPLDIPSPTKQTKELTNKHGV